jgi:hypothetical protein
MTGRRRVAYLVAVFAALAAFLVLRRDGLLNGSTSAVDAIIVAAVLAIVLLPAFRKVTVGGVTLEPEVRELIQREVGKTQMEALRLLVARDVQMIPLWEREHSGVPSDFSAEKLALLERHTVELERLWVASAREERAHVGLALREVYWQWLAAARHHWASSAAYQAVRGRVEKGLTTLGGDSP